MLTKGDVYILFNYLITNNNTIMSKNVQEQLIATMAETLPFKILVRQVERAVKEYLDDPNEDRQGFLMFVMQIAMLKHVMQHDGKTADDVMQDIHKHSDIMNLFKENNN